MEADKLCKRIGRRYVWEWCLVAVLVSWAQGVMAVPFTPGNLLVESQTPGFVFYRIVEYALDGSIVQTFTPERPPTQTGVFQPRELTASTDGLLHLYNGASDPYLSTYDPASGSWSHVTHAGWSTASDLTYGGIARSGNTVFVVDQETCCVSPEEARGIIAFDLVLGTSIRFASDFDPVDLALGLDGRLWALDAEGALARAFDPVSFAALGTVSLAAAGDVRALAVGAAGEFFVATWDGRVVHLGSTGGFVASRSFAGSFIDIDLSSDGLIALGSRSGTTWLTDTIFSFATPIETGRVHAFVAFVPLPEPSGTVLLSAAIAVGCLARSCLRPAG